MGGEQRKYDGVDFTIVRSVRRRWHIYITKNKKHRRPARRILIYSTNAETEDGAQIRVLVHSTSAWTSKLTAL